MFEKQIFTKTFLSLLFLVAESQQQKYPEYVSEDCFPSSPCALDIDCSEMTEDTFLDLEQAGCNQSIVSGDQMKDCRCESSTCYKFGEHCLNACDNHQSGELSHCISCIRNSEQSLTTNGSQINHLCSEHCRGMCLDLFCDETDLEECSADCVAGYWGRSCLEECAHGCPRACHADSGFCMNCTAGSYGPECELKCSSNCLNGICFSSNGKCEACIEGYLGQDCNETCPEGLYGDMCAFKCSEKCKNNRCDHAKGRCIDGCKPGYFGFQCKQACPASTYGQDCLSNCPASCDESKPCHHETGKCLSGCLLGFMGEYCNKTCPVHKYGANCLFNCSTSCFDGLCNVFSGTCLACEESFYGSLCQYKMNLNEIKHKTLAAEVSSIQALLMIAGIALLGVLMWIGVAYLLLQQRKKILRDAAKGINPQYSQWGMFPYNRNYKRAMKVYKKNYIHLGGGDAEDSHNMKQSEEDTEETRERMIHRARKKLWAWTNPKKKLKPPNEVDLERVSKWLAQNNGIGNVGHSLSSEIGDIHSETEATESSEWETEFEDETESSSSISTSEENETAGEGLPTETYTIQGPNEETEMPYSSSKGQEEVTPDNEESTQMMNTEPSLDQGISQTSAGQTSSYEPLFIGNVPMMKDTIYLNPGPQHGGPGIRGEPKYLKETTRVKWLSYDKYGSKRITRVGSTSSKEPFSTATGSSSSSKPEFTSSSSSSSSSGSSTLTNTNTSYKTRSNDSGSTTSGETSESSSSEMGSDSSEGASASTKIQTRKEQSAMDGEISFSFGNQEISASRAETKTDNTENTITEKVPALGFFQKVAGLFRRKENVAEEQIEPQITTPAAQGAGGLPRPFSDRFLINRLETWQRNRGLEVKVDDGVMEVAGGKNQRKHHSQGHSKARTGPSVSTKTKSSGTAEGSSWVSSDASDKTHRKSFGTSKPSYTWTTSEDLTDVPSTMITDTIRI